MLVDKLRGMCPSVGTDLSRPFSLSIADKDVINRSLQATYPSQFVKQHHRSIQDLVRDRAPVSNLRVLLVIEGSATAHNGNFKEVIFLWR